MPKGFVKWLVGGEKAILRFGIVTDFLDLIADPFEVGLVEVAVSGAIDDALASRFVVDEDNFLAKFRSDFFAGEEVEEEDFTPAHGEAAQDILEFGGVHETVGDKDGHGAAAAFSHHFIESPDVIVRAIGFIFFKIADHVFKVVTPRAGWPPIFGRNGFAASKKNESGGILLLVHQDREDSTEEAAVVKLMSRAFAEIHAEAGIKKEVAGEIGFLFVFPDDEFIGATVNLPVDTVRRIAGQKCAVRGKFLAASREGAAVNPVGISFHKTLRKEQQVGRIGQQLGVDLKRSAGGLHRGLGGGFLDDLVEEVRGVHSFSPGLEVGEDAVPEDQFGD